MIKNKTQYLRYNKKIIENFIMKGNLNEAKEKLEEIRGEFSNTIDFILLDGILEYLNKNYVEAEKKLLKNYYITKYNEDINYNLAIVNYSLENYKKSLEYYAKVYVLSDEKDKEILLKEILELFIDIFDNEEIILKIENTIMNLNYNPKSYPCDTTGTIRIGKSFFEKEKEYYIGAYDYYLPERDGILIDNIKGLEGFLKVEALEGIKTREYNSYIDGKMILPIMVLSNNQKIKLEIDKDEYKLENLLNRYYYYPVENAKIKITSEEEFIIGKPIKNSFEDNKPKLVLNIFVDGLSKIVLEEEGFNNIMPNTYNFFKEGTICNNAYVTGEWTYPNMASFYTGQNMINHGMIHPLNNSNLKKDIKTLGELFSEEGYYTAKIDGDWRSTPEYGYIRGIDRFVYQAAVRGMDAEDVIMETIEHIEAFDNNKFMWICLSDLHDIADGFEGRISTQTKNNLKDRFTEEEKKFTSVRTKYDLRLRSKYIRQIIRLDNYLGLLFNYLLEKFNEDEFIVSLISDHGQGYLVKPEDIFLSDERIKVPFLFRGRNIKKGSCEEFVQGLDLISILSRLLNINDSDYLKRDSNLPLYFGGEKEREFIYSQSIFPGSPYRVLIKTKKNYSYLESSENVKENLSINLDNYKMISNVMDIDTKEKLENEILKNSYKIIF